MNDVEELKEYLLVHARIQGIGPRRYREIVAGISSDTPFKPDSWTARWSEEGRSLERSGRLLEACRCYNLARFPFVDGPARKQALDDCVATFDRWRAAGTGLEPLTVSWSDGQVRCWAGGLSASERRPLVLLSGGTVSIKEQWAPLLPLFLEQGFAAIALEMPGVGQNSIRYTPEAWQMLPAILDAVADRADVDRTFAICLSFSGHLALRAAGADPRIRGIITAGAPVRRFFTDAGWRQRVPRIATDTLEHLTGEPVDDMSRWALDDRTLDAVRIPVHYLISRRDEIVPPAEAEVLRAHIPGLRTLANNDVHGSPRRVLESRIWVLRSLLGLRGGNRVRRTALSGALGLLRLLRNH